MKNRQYPDFRRRKAAAFCERNADSAIRNSHDFMNAQRARRNGAPFDVYDGCEWEFAIASILFLPCSERAIVLLHQRAILGGDW